MTTRKMWLGVLTAGLLAASAAHGGELVVNNSLSDPEGRAAVEAMVAAFERANPDVHVQLNTMEHEAFKTAIRNWLTTKAPDVVFWAAGERLRTFVRRGLIEDVSDVWESEGLRATMTASASAVSTNGKAYAVPVSANGWGVYYRKDVLDHAGISPPKTFDDLVAACTTLRAKGLTPIAIGTKEPWTAAAWFDYIDMRLNGLDFHVGLLAGKVPYSDPKVLAVFDLWRKLLDARCFLDNHPAYTFQEALPTLVNGQAGMYLIGSFIASAIPADVRDRVGLIPFPTIDPGVKAAEDLPLDTVAIPARAQNKADARRFVAFASRPDVLTTLNSAIGRLPPNSRSSVGSDPLTQTMFGIANGAAGVGQFFDRDSDPEMAQVALEGFQRFMLHPDQLEAIIARLDAAQKRIASR